MLFVYSSVLFAQKLSQKDRGDTSISIDSTINNNTDSKKTLKLGIGKKGFGSNIAKDTSIVSNADSLKTVIDSTFLSGIDSIASINSDSVVAFSKDTLKFPVTYKARDSMIYDISKNKVFLYGLSNVTYDDVNLDAHFIELQWDSNLVYAETEKDSAGKTIGDVVFKDDGNEYKSKKISYNFKSEKGKVYQVRTQEGDGFMHAEAVKRNEYDEWYGSRAKYTTCDLEHPHYYLSSRKMKLVPDKIIVSGPANIVIADIPTPLYVPFAIFPVKKDRKSGIIFPQYGDESNSRGFFLRNGGYYIYFNDNIDLALTGDIYTKGSYALRANTNYAKRYKYSGNFSLQYGRNRNGDPAEPAFNVINDFKVNWRHQQDSKARPGSTFSGNVNAGSTTFDRNFSYTQTAVQNSQFNSNISYSKAWLNRPSLNFSLNAAHSQSLVTRRIDLTLPNITFGVSRITPFKSKIKPTKGRWYEEIGIGYNMQFQNQVSAIDSNFLSLQTLKDANFGIRQTIPINTTFKVLKYVNVNPAFNYNEYWYFKTVNKLFSPELIFDPNTDTVTDFGRVISDTTYKFKTARDFDASVTFSTIVYGMYQFKKGKLKGIRHVMTPRISVQYQPDFASQQWGYYKTVATDTVPSGDRQYSVFEPNGNFPGQPRRGRIGGVGLALSNILEAKIFSKKDTVKNEKKIKILENLTINTLYNFAIDTLKLSPISISGRNSFLNGAMQLNFSANFDPYTTDSSFRRINTFMWESDRRLTRFTSASIALGGRIQPKRKTPLNPTRGSDQEREYILNNPQGFYDFNIPWSLNLNFDLNIQKGNTTNIDTLLLTAAAIRFDFDVNVTKNWKLNLTSGYNFATKLPAYTQVNVVRDLHCWELRFQWTAYPVQQRNYNIQINVKSSMLQELKLSRKDVGSNRFTQL